MTQFEAARAASGDQHPVHASWLNVVEIFLSILDLKTHPRVHDTKLWLAPQDRLQVAELSDTGGCKLTAIAGPLDAAKRQLRVGHRHAVDGD